MTLAQKTLTSLVTIVAGAGLMVFATVGTFDDSRDVFPSSELARAEAFR